MKTPRAGNPARGHRAYHNGVAAERRAVDLLEEDGLSVLATRHRTPLGELDIVAADAENLIIVEVKQRARLSDAAYALTSRQSQRLLAATEYLLATNPAYQRSNVRIDVIVFDENFQARRIKDAVRAA